MTEARSYFADEKLCAYKIRPKTAGLSTITKRIASLLGSFQDGNELTPDRWLYGQLPGDEKQRVSSSKLYMDIFSHISQWYFCAHPALIYLLQISFYGPKCIGALTLHGKKRKYGCVGGTESGWYHVPIPAIAIAAAAVGLTTHLN